MDEKIPTSVEEARKLIADQVRVAAKFALRDNKFQPEVADLVTAIEEGIIPWSIGEEMFAKLLDEGSYHGINRYQRFLAANLALNHRDPKSLEAEAVNKSSVTAIHVLLESGCIELTNNQNQEFIESFISLRKDAERIRRLYINYDLTHVTPKNSKFADVQAVHMAEELFRRSVPSIVPNLKLSHFKGVYSHLSFHERSKIIELWMARGPFQPDIASFFSEKLHEILQDTTHTDRETRVKAVALTQRLDGMQTTSRPKPQPQMVRPLKPPIRNSG